ncbi:hypothetical protein DL98DRAFT_615367 [Cadophora sp. DSE1049]|nr:hypothetical protein DL98DRAFT_615367 [Cadophora sp. DSE1049]
MHHFTIICDETLFRFIEPWRLRDEKQVASRDIATRWVVGLALQDEGIMDALFAFSAFNLRRLNPNDKQLLLASHKYTARAIAAHAEQLRQETWKSNVEIVFAASLLITFIAVHNPWPENKDQLPLHWFQPWQGVRTIVRSSLESFHTHEIKKLLEVELCQKLPPPDSTTHNTTFDFLLDGLDYETTDVETVAAYEKNVKRLSIIYDHPKRDYVFKFAAKVGPRFVQLLDQKDPRAMTIVGYFFMLLKTVEEVWWLPRPSGEEFWTLVKLLPVAWRPRMWWAVKEFAAAANDKGDSVPTPCKSTCDSSLLLQADCCQLRP